MKFEKVQFLWYKNKYLFDKTSQEMGFVCLEYNTIKSQLIININKQLYLDITSFDKIPDESVYYKTENKWKLYDIQKS